MPRRTGGSGGAVESPPAQPPSTIATTAIERSLSRMPDDTQTGDLRQRAATIARFRWTARPVACYPRLYALKTARLPMGLLHYAAGPTSIDSVRRETS